MNEGLYVIAGTIIGTLGSIGTTFLAALLERRSRFPKYDQAVNKVLLEELSRELPWQSLEVLARVVGMTEQDTREF